MRCADVTEARSDVTARRAASEAAEGHGGLTPEPALSVEEG